MTACGLLLAAGSGSRFGRPKALVELDGELFVERGVRLLVEGGCHEVTVVLGAAADAVRAQSDLAGAHVVVNADWASGMGSSLRAGLTALGTGPAAAAVVALADQPLVGPAAVRRLLAAWATGAVAAVATYGGRPRNPVLLARSVWPDVLRIATGDAGARGFLRAHPDLVTPVPCDGTGSPYDVDTVADLAVAAAATVAAGRTSASRGNP